ncbi:hypothetical protein DRO57_03190 [Candidatus Bathyarchaeota archaeon]|nr:MAG: hypothetical protein DRO57_03190 [Candidatus Bathyarchaeota archaeon]
MSIRETRAFEAFTALIIALLVIVLAIFSTGMVSLLSSIKYAPPLTLEKYPFFLWTYRGLDVLAQGFLLLATVLGVVALLREDEGPGVEEEPVVEEEEEG